MDTWNNKYMRAYDTFARPKANISAPQGEEGQRPSIGRSNKKVGNNCPVEPERERTTIGRDITGVADDSRVSDSTPEVAHSAGYVWKMEGILGLMAGSREGKLSAR